MNRFTSGPTTEALTDYDDLQQLIRLDEFIVYNSTAATIPACSVVEKDSTNSRSNAVRPVQSASSQNTLGIVIEDIPPGRFGVAYGTGFYRGVTGPPYLPGMVRTSGTLAAGTRLTVASDAGIGVLRPGNTGEKEFGMVIQTTPNVLLKFSMFSYATI